MQQPKLRPSERRVLVYSKFINIEHVTCPNCTKSFLEKQILSNIPAKCEAGQMSALWRTEISVFIVGWVVLSTLQRTLLSLSFTNYFSFFAVALKLLSMGLRTSCTCFRLKSLPGEGGMMAEWWDWQDALVYADAKCSLNRTVCASFVHVWSWSTSSPHSWLR